MTHEHTPLNNSPPPPGEYIISETDIEKAKLRLKQFGLRTRPTTLEELKTILDTTIKHDDTNKQILFLTMLLDFTEEDQQNISFNAPSSTGKSYLALEVAKYFPEKDINIHSYTSPTAFFHELGKLTHAQHTEHGNPVGAYHV
ncbi:MAG: hypothetical protein V1710_00205 [Candidatus Bathyarchaeota archaeon]